jgi:uncharacterized protein (TIGR03067 family)
MLATILTLSLVASAEPPKLSETAQKELKHLEGKWKIVKGVTSKGEDEVDPNKIEVFMLFKGIELTVESSNKDRNKEKKETLKISAIDPTTDPKCIDLLETLSGDRGERTVEAIFKIDGDTLLFAMCVPKEGKQRPAGFDKPTDPQTVVWVLKRDKN